MENKKQCPYCNEQKYEAIKKSHKCGCWLYAKHLSMLIAVALFASCSDNKLAKELDGKWQTQYATTYSNGEKLQITETVSFTYQESSDKDGGIFTETRHYQSNELEYGDDTYQVQYASSVRGEYEMLMGDLYLDYDLSTLQVTMNPSDVKITPGSLSSAFSMMSDAFNYLENPRKEIAKSYRKDVYSELFELYKSNSETAGGLNLKIDGNTMSYDTEDIDDLTYTRIQ